MQSAKIYSVLVFLIFSVKLSTPQQNARNSGGTCDYEVIGEVNWCICGLNMESSKLTLDMDIFPKLDCEKVRFNNISFDTIPKNVFQLSINATDYYLDNCELKSLQRDNFEGISSSGKVESIHLDNNQIEILPDDFLADSVNLVELSISHNKLQTLEQNCFRTLENLKILRLDNNKIQTLADVFLPLKSLLKLDLSRNNIYILPDRFLKASLNLDVLSLHSNNFGKIELYTFEKNNELRVIYLHNNYITSLPDMSFYNMKKLEKVTLNNNRLTDIPKALSYALKLVSLFISKNSINQVESYSLARGDLEVLEMNNNYINELPSGAFKNLKNLKYLILSQNGLQIIYEQLFYENRKLIEISLDHNSIEDLPLNVFVNNIQLRSLQLQNNNIKSLQPGIFRPLEFLEALDLTYNYISYIPIDLFANNLDLKHLFLRGNNLALIDVNIVTNPAALPLLGDIKPGTWTTPTESFSILHNLRELDLVLNDFVYVSKRTFYRMPELQILNLTSTKLSYIEKDTFEENLKLRKVWLGSNQLQEFDVNCLSKSQNLEFLDISRNNLSSLANYETFANLTSMRLINLSNNIFECTYLNELVIFLKKLNIEIVSSECRLKIM